MNISQGESTRGDQRSQGLERIALVVSYDGSGFDGWQTQPGGNTVQDCLESAVAQIAGQRSQTVCAGRTDSGVHAERQVVHFDVDCRRPLSAWVRGVNTHLPPAIAVRHAVAVDPSFHARYGALRRCYRYLLLSAPTREPLLSGRVGWTHRTLDRVAISDAAGVLIGEHDFSAFRSAQCQALSPIRRIESIIVERLDDDGGVGRDFPGIPSGSGQLLQIRIVGNAFLHHMVRNIVGALVMVGAGQRPVRWLSDVLRGRDRRLSAPTFDAGGLFFEGVEYDRRFALPSWPKTFHSGPRV